MDTDVAATTGTGRFRLSKTRFATGRQCRKWLWWAVHEPDAPELVPDETTRALFDQGTRVGEAARRYVPGGVLIDLPHGATEARLAETRRAIESGVPAIYEATFFEDDVLVRADILERRARGWGIIEVKSSTSVKERHYVDAIIQTHVVRRAGVDVTKVEIMHLDRECVFPDLPNLFCRVDVTPEVEAGLILVHREVERQLDSLRGPLPAIAIGAHCDTPYACPFKVRCWAAVPEHHVTTLYHAGARAFDYVDEGFQTVLDVPTERLRNPVARRQQKAIRENRMVVEPGLHDALELFEPPLAFLDFETVAPAIPVWAGCSPYDQIPVQFSCHVVRADGGLTHHEWLAPSVTADDLPLLKDVLAGTPPDPRRAIAMAVIEACRGSRTVVGYNVPFERGCLERLARACPDVAGDLDDLSGRLVDLLTVIQGYVYHPAFHGSLGLKSVLPVLVPHLNHGDLLLSDGRLASARLEQLIIHGEPADAAAREALRQQLLDYCRLDTLATVQLLEKLKQLAEAG